jgi:hypothetical protein
MVLLLVNIRYLKFWVRQRHELGRIPDSTLDWMIHACDIEEKDCQVYLDSVKAKKFSDAWYEPLPIAGAHSRVSICKGTCSNDQQTTEKSDTEATQRESMSIKVLPREEITDVLDGISSQLGASYPEHEVESPTDGASMADSGSVRNASSPGRTSSASCNISLD